MPAGQPSLRQPPVSAQVAAVLRVWVVSISAAARLGLGLAAAVAALLRRSSAVVAAIVAVTAASTVIVMAAASFPARWPVP